MVGLNENITTLPTIELGLVLKYSFVVGFLFLQIHILTHWEMILSLLCHLWGLDDVYKLIWDLLM